MTQKIRKSLKSRWVWFWVLLIIDIGFESTPVFAQQPKPSQIMDQYRAQRVTWTTNIWPYANTLFGVLAVIEFAWSAAVMLLEKSDLQSWTAALIRKMMWIGAFYALLLNGRTWIPAIIDSFEKIGQTSSGFSSIAPSDVFAQGIDIAGALMDSASTSAFFTNTGVCLSLVVAAALIVLAFTGICIQFIVAMVESYIIVAAGFLFLGFGGSRWTAPYTERYIGLAVSIGVKIMLLYLLIGTGMNISVGWMNDAEHVSTSTAPAMSAFEIMGASLIFLMLCWQIPKLFSAVLGGSPALTGGDLLSTATGLVAGAAAVGSIAVGGTALAARGAAALTSVGAAAGAGANGANTGLGIVGTGIGSATRGSGESGGSVVPPPSSPPSGPSNGGPKQPSPPPRNGTSNGISMDVAAVGSGSNGLRRYQGSNGNGTPEAHAIDSALRALGGEPLVGSGFENERPASGFAPSARIVSAPPVRSTIVGSGTGIADSVPPPKSSAPGISSAGSSGTPVSAASIQAGAGSPPAALSQAGPADRTSGVMQPPTPSRRERIGAVARKTDQALSRTADRLRGLRNQLGGVPSDTAPHTPPPRMPIDHHE